MWYTTRQEGYDDPKHSKRGPSLPGLIESRCNSCLRVGFLSQALALAGMFVLFWAFQGFGIFTFDLHYTNEKMRASVAFRVLLTILSFVYVAGAAKLLAFQLCLADDAVWARGYRAGSKMFGIAALFDLLSSTMQAVFYLYMAIHYDETWWTHFTSGGYEWTFLAFTRVLHAVAFCMYGDSTFCLEVYHDDGSGGLHAVVNSFAFAAAGIAEIAVVFLAHGAVGAILTLATLVSALAWAVKFEPEVVDLSPSLNETELVNNVEDQAGMFCRLPAQPMGPEVVDGHK